MFNEHGDGAGLEASGLVDAVEQLTDDTCREARVQQLAYVLDLRYRVGIEESLACGGALSRKEPLVLVVTQ